LSASNDFVSASRNSSAVFFGGTFVCTMMALRSTFSQSLLRGVKKRATGQQ
jgi:hypothetical protein